MEILFVTNYPSPYKVDFFNELGKFCNVTVLFEQNINDVSEREKNWFVENYTNFKAVFLQQTKIFNSYICLDIKDYIDNNNFDLIIIGNYHTLTGMYAIKFLRKRKIKFAIQADGGIAKSGRGFKESVKKYLISSAEWWFSSSEVTDSYFVRYGAEGKNIFRYPFTSLKNADILTTEIEKEEKEIIKNKLSIKEENMVISVGRFIDIKGFDVLIKSAQYISGNTGIYIIGGLPTDEYKKLIDQYNIKNVHFLNFKSKEELIDYYKAADLFVLPTRGDVWGLVINEAMAFGLPIITTDKCVAGLELVKDNKNGFICSVNDVRQLAEKINCVLLDKEKKYNMGQYSLKKIEEYTIENMADRYIEIIKEIKVHS